MAKLIVHPTDMSSWQALIDEAQSARSVKLGEELESYLVFLLMRFTQETQMASSIMALDFLEAHQGEGRERKTLLRDVGDKCLLISGLFPGRCEKRRVKVSYFVSLGQTAYSSLAVADTQELAALFAKLSECFVPLMDVLLATREVSQSPLSLLAAQELWQDCHSHAALERLQRDCDAIPFSLGENENSNKKH